MPPDTPGRPSPEDHEATPAPGPPRARAVPIDALPSALGRVAEIAREVGGREPVVLLDFDGTLAPIVERPEDAALPEPTRARLAVLASRRGVAIVSGRDLDDLRRRVALDEVYYAGCHGMRVAGPGGFAREHEEARRFVPALDEAQARLERELAPIDGVQVERKRFAVAVHFRRAPGAGEQVRRAVERARGAGGGLRSSDGRMVLELRPGINWDKGAAIGWLLEALGLDEERAFPIYVGDDVTDEDAFAAVERRGLPIVVRGRDGTTRARLSLADTDEVRELLGRLDAELEHR